MSLDDAQFSYLNVHNTKHILNFSFALLSTLIRFRLAFEGKIFSVSPNKKFSHPHYVKNFVGA